MLATELRKIVIIHNCHFKSVFLISLSPLGTINSKVCMELLKLVKYSSGKVWNPLLNQMNSLSLDYLSYKSKYSG